MDDIDKYWGTNFESLVIDSESAPYSSAGAQSIPIDASGNSSNYTDYRDLGLSLLGLGLAGATLFVASGPVVLFLAAKGVSVGLAVVTINGVEIVTGQSFDSANQALGYAKPFGQLGFIAAQSLGQSHNVHTWVDGANLAGDLVSNSRSLIKSNSYLDWFKSTTKFGVSIASNSEKIGEYGYFVLDRLDRYANELVLDPVQESESSYNNERDYPWESGSSSNFEDYVIEYDDSHSGDDWLSGGEGNDDENQIDWA